MTPEQEKTTEKLVGWLLGIIAILIVILVYYTWLIGELR